MDDGSNDSDLNPNLPIINFTDLAYAAPFIGALLLGCFALSLCCYLWRRISSSRGYSSSIESSSNSYRNHQRASQLQRQRATGQNQMFGRGRTTRGVGNQFVSWARDQMRYPTSTVRSSLPGQNYQAPQQARDGCGTANSGNNLLSPMATQYPRATQGSGGRGGHNPGTTGEGYSHALSNSEGFSQATAPPPSYSCAVGYQNAATWNLPGYGYQSTQPCTEPGTGGQVGQGDHDVLPPPYEAAVANGQNTRRT